MHYTSPTQEIASKSILFNSNNNKENSSKAKSKLVESPPQAAKQLSPNKQANESPNILTNAPFCQYCSKSFCNKYFLRTHMNKAHGKTLIIENNSNNSMISSLIGGSQINDDGELIVDPQNMDETYFASKVVDRVACDICSKQVCNKYFLRTHKQKVHGIYETSHGSASKNGSFSASQQQDGEEGDVYEDGDNDNTEGVIEMDDDYGANDEENEEMMDEHAKKNEVDEELNADKELGELLHEDSDETAQYKQSRMADKAGKIVDGDRRTSSCSSTTSSKNACLILN